MTLPIERIREILSPNYTVDRELGSGGWATVEAFAHLEIAIAKGWRHREWLENDHDFNSIRETPRFRAIVESL